MSSFRPLAWFWAAVLTLLGGGALTLQLLGPPKTIAQAAAVRTTQPVPAGPATAKATQADPAPALPATSLAIPEPRDALLEPAPDQPALKLPRIDSRGLAPQKLYAGAFDPSERHPRVAFVIDGIGLDAPLSEQAMTSLPSAVDFAYSAYAPTEQLRALAGEGRRMGRECLVSIPMEPSLYPAYDEGGDALLTGADPDRNERLLYKALAHVPGCVGATGASDGLGGERFTAQRTNFGEMLGEMAGRGLLYLDPRPRQDDRPDPGTRRVDDVVDASPAGEPAGPDAIDAGLARLSRLAAERGAAIGLAGPPTPVLIQRVAIWARALAANGIVLVPLTAIPAEQPAQEAQADPSH